MRFKHYFTIISLVIFIAIAGETLAASFTIDNLNLREVRPIDNFPKAYFKVGLEEAWEQINNEPSLTLSPIIIGIIDTGLDRRHPEFSQFPEVDLGNTPIEALIDVGDEGFSHGTNVAGIIGANNISATYSDNYEFPHMNGVVSGVKDLDYTLEMRRQSSLPKTIGIFTTAKKIFEISNSNPQVVNLSFESNYDPLGTVIFSSSFFVHPDILFVVAAGNSNLPVALVTPANLGSASNVITVGATALNDSRLPNSNFGSAVSISAPGEKVFSPTFFIEPLNADDYEDFTDTSASTPMVTGVAGLIKAINPLLTPAEIKIILTKFENTDPVTTEPLKPIGRRLNAFKAICDEDVLDCDGVSPEGPPVSCPLSGTLTRNGTIPLLESPCVVSSLSIPSGVTLTVDPGVIIKMHTSNSQMNVSGTLNTKGTLSQPVIITSFQDDVGGDTNGDGGASSPGPGQWINIQTNTGGTANLTNTTVRFGGRPSQFGLLLVSGGTLNLNNSRIAQSGNRGILVNSGTVTLTDTEIDNGGVIGIDQRGGTVTVNNASITGHFSEGIRSVSGDTLTVNNTDFQNNDEALRLSPSVDFTHANNTATNNNFNGIVISGGTTANRIWTKDTIPYVVRNVSIASGTTLTVDPGVIMKMQNSNSNITVNGTLNTNGTLSQPIFITALSDDGVDGQDTGNNGATTPTAGQWTRMEVNSGGTANLTNTTVRFGGRPSQFGLIVVGGGTLNMTDSIISQSASRGILFNSGAATIADSVIDSGGIIGIDQRGGSITVNNSSIRNHINEGIRSVFGTGVSLSVNNTDFQNNDEALFLSPEVNFTHVGNTATNNNFNGIIMNGTMLTDKTWTKDTIPYVIFSTPATSTVTIASSATLDIDPGAIMKFAFGTSRIVVNGTLNANGTLADPIFFTSIRDDVVDGQDTSNDGATTPTSGSWSTISVNPGSIANLSHSTIRFGGRSSIGGLQVVGGTLSFSNSHLANNGGINLNHLGGTTTITNSEIDTAQRGISQISGTVTVSQSSIHDNTQFGAFAGTGVLMQAQNNWWGDPSGPFHPTLNPTGLGNAVSDNVNFIPFLNTDPVGNLP